MMGPMMTLHNPRGTLSAHTALLINTCLKARSAFPAKPYVQRRAEREAVPLPLRSLNSKPRTAAISRPIYCRQPPNSWPSWKFPNLHTLPHPTLLGGAKLDVRRRFRCVRL